jgi:hypothetical protein
VVGLEGDGRGAGQWVAPSGALAPPSDPAPPGKQPAAWLEPPADWRSVARDRIPHLDLRSLAWVDVDGFPVSAPVIGLEQTESGFRLQVGRRLPGTPEGPACFTVHGHPEEFTGQENHTFLGQVRGGDGEAYDFVVERALADWSITGNKLVRSLGLVRKARSLKPTASGRGGASRATGSPRQPPLTARFNAG